MKHAPYLVQLAKMKKQTPFVIAGLFSIYAVTAFAKEPQLDRCDRYQSTPDSNACWQQRAHSSRMTLEKALGRIRQKIVSNEAGNLQALRVDALNNSQKAWESYVAIQCGEVLELNSGTGFPRYAAICEISKTKSRLQELKDNF